MKDVARKDASFAQMVHDRLADLVRLAKDVRTPENYLRPINSRNLFSQSKQRSRSHSFDCMNREKRQFVHEYCSHFGAESESFDAEPKRNVVATAVRDKVREENTRSC